MQCGGATPDCGQQRRSAPRAWLDAIAAVALQLATVGAAVCIRKHDGRACATSAAARRGMAAAQALTGRNSGSARQCESSERSKPRPAFFQLSSRKECVQRHVSAQYAPAAARGGRYITALSRTGSSAAASAARRAISRRRSSSADALATPASSAPNVWFCARCGGRSVRARRVRPAGAARERAMGTATAAQAPRTRHGHVLWCASFSCDENVLAACTRDGQATRGACERARGPCAVGYSVLRRPTSGEAGAHLVAAFPRHGLSLACERGAAVATRHR